MTPAFACKPAVHAQVTGTAKRPSSVSADTGCIARHPRSRRVLQSDVSSLVQPWCWQEKYVHTSDPQQPEPGSRMQVKLPLTVCRFLIFKIKYCLL